MRRYAKREEKTKDFPDRFSDKCRKWYVWHWFSDEFWKKKSSTQFLDISRLCHLNWCWWQRQVGGFMMVTVTSQTCHQQKVTATSVINMQTNEIENYFWFRRFRPILHSLSHATLLMPLNSYLFLFLFTLGPTFLFENTFYVWETEICVDI